MKALAATYGVSDQGSRAGVVTFSYYTEHSIKLNDHTSLASFNEAVDNIALMGSTTRIDKALRMTQKDLFSIPNGGRPGVNKVLIVLTDGSQTQDAGAEDPGDVAEELRNAGIRVLAIGIGKGINAFLHRICTCQHPNLTLSVTCCMLHVVFIIRSVYREDVINSTLL